MNNVIRFPVVLLFVVLLASYTSRGQTTPAQYALFSRVTTPDLRDLESPLPPDAPVIRVDTEAHAALRVMPMGSRVQIDLPLQAGRTVRLDVERYAVIDAFTVLTAMTSSGPVPIDPPKSVLLKGTVIDIPGSFVTLAVYPGMALGRVVIGESMTEEFILSPLSVGSNSTIAIVPASRLTPPDLVPCSVTDESIDRDPSGKATEVVQAGTLRRITLALEGDTPYFIDHGRDSAVAAAYAEAVIAASSAVYERDVAATLYIGQLRIWTTTDPYPGTTSNNLLTQFRDYWRVNNNAVNRSAAMLLSGQNGIGGIAYLNVLCSKSNGYAVSGTNNNIVYPRTTYAWDTDVTSHELGHNIGSPHTHSCTWNPAIDSCYAAEGNCFTGTKAVRGTIMSYCHLTTMGTSLEFHPLVSQLMQNRLAAASCVSLISDLDVVAGPDTAICNGSSVTLRAIVTGGTQPIRITWTPSAGMVGAGTLFPTVQPSVTTSYIVEIRDVFNATALDTVTITVNPRVSITVPVEATVCVGSPLAITLPSVGGTAPLTYRWSSADIDTTTTVQTLTYTPSTNGLLTVTASDSKGCRDQQTMQVFVSPRPIVAMSVVEETLCPGTPVEVIANASSGVSPYSWSWFVDGVPVGQATDRLQYLADVTHDISVIVTDALGCVDTSSTSVRVHDLRVQLDVSVINIPAIPLCEPEFPAWITVVNTGNDTVRFSSFIGDTVKITSRDLPLVVAPGTSFVLPITVRLPSSRVVLDTVYLLESACNTRLPLIIRGDRGRIVSDLSTNNTYAHVVDCAVTQERLLTLSVQNKTPAGISILRARSRAFKTDLTLTTQPVSVPTNATRSAEFRGTFKVLASQQTDTIDVYYEAHGCTGTFVAIAAVPVTSLTVQQPSSVVFDTSVSPALEDVERPITIRVTADNLKSVTVTNVKITGPFRSSLQSGSRIPTNVDQSVIIAFQPSQLAQDGLAGGELTYTFDSCHTAEVIHLEAERIVVDVSEEDHSSVPSITAIAGEITVRQHHGDLRVIDLQGRVVVHRSIDGEATISIVGLPAGLYTVLLVDTAGQVHRTSFIHP